MEFTSPEDNEPKNDNEKRVAQYLGQQMRKLRMEQNMTRPQMAQLLGATKEDLDKMERGEVCPSGMYLYRLTKTFEVPAEYWIDPIDKKK